MDHFCPWINNCVGFYNQKYFFLFVMYNCILTWFMLINMSPTFANIVGSKLDELSFDFGDLNFQLVVCYMLLCLLCFGLTGFLSFHTFLVSHNYTTIEYLEKRTCWPKADWVNPYNLGVLKNLQSVFGNNLLEWLFPVRLTVPGNGLFYDVNEQAIPISKA